MERFLQISASSQRVIKEGMLFNVDIGLQNIPLSSSSSSSSPTYSIKISDTFLITSSGAVALTTTPKNYSDVAYILAEDEKEDKKDKKNDKKKETAKVKVKEESKKKEREEAQSLAATIGGRFVFEQLLLNSFFHNFLSRYETRNAKRRFETEENAEEKRSAEAKRKAHQKDLWLKLKTSALEKLDSSSKLKKKEKKEETEEISESYAKPQNLPADMQRNRVYVDSSSDSIILPIYGDLVPFHISTVKNVSTPDDTLE